MLAQPPAIPPAAVAPPIATARADLVKRGPDYVIARYYAVCGDGVGARRAAAGDPGWISLTVGLVQSHAGDGCESEALPIILGEAMGRRPRALLPYVVTDSPDLALGRICLPDRIEPEAATVRADLTRLRRALVTVREPRYARAKAACLGEAARAEAKLNSGS